MKCAFGSRESQSGELFSVKAWGSFLVFGTGGAEQCEVAADRWALQQKQVTREPTPQGDGRVHTEGQRVISCPFPLGPLGDMRTGRERAEG